MWQNYQDAFLTPGILPSLASSRKQIRQSPKSLIYPLLRPHLKQRLTIRVLNFGFLSALALTEVFAIFINNPAKRDFLKLTNIGQIVNKEKGQMSYDILKI